jgi:hypothetical protein
MGTKICDLGVTAALTNAAQPVFTGFGKPQAITLAASATITGGGTAMKAWVQTSLDGGATWYDFASFAFTNASGSAFHNLDGRAQIAGGTVRSGTLADNTVQHGLLGDRFRVLVTSTGVYTAGTKLEIWMEAR